MEFTAPEISQPKLIRNGYICYFEKYSLMSSPGGNLIGGNLPSGNFLRYDFSGHPMILISRESLNPIL